MSSRASVIPDIVGHRGAAGEAPENTIAGLRHAIACGVRHVEIDLRLAADNQLVVIHDHDLKRTTGRKGKVADLDTAALQTCYAQFASDNSKHANETLGVPSLKQLLISSSEIKSYQLEVKSDKHSNSAALVKALAEFFPDSASAKRVIITSFDTALVGELKRLCPYLKTGVIAKKNLSEAINSAIELNCHYLCLHYTLALNNIEQLQKTLATNSLHLSVWTVNDEQLIPALIQIPVNSIITDVPTLMIKALQTVK